MTLNDSYRITKPEVDYILEHSGSSLILCDKQYQNLVTHSSKYSVIICDDSSPPHDPYENLLKEGREFGKGKGWESIELETDEFAALSLCYTSGTTGRPKGTLSLTLHVLYRRSDRAYRRYQ